MLVLLEAVLKECRCFNVIVFKSSGFFNRLAKKDKDLVSAEKNASYHESKVHELQSRLTQSHNDRKRLEDENKV